MTSTDVSTHLDQRAAAFALAVLDTISKTAGERLTEGKNVAVEDYFTRGDRVVVTDPTGERLGLVWMTDPKPKAEVVNREAFTAWHAETDPDAILEVPFIRPDCMSAAIDVLAEHAPDLLDSRLVVREQHEAATLKQAVKKNADPIPGVEVRTPRGSMTVKLDDDGAGRIRELVASGTVDPLRELPAVVSEQDGEAP